MAELNTVVRDEFGTLLVRFRKEDGGWHRASIPAGGDVDRVLDAVDGHLRRDLGDATGVRAAHRTEIKDRIQRADKAR